MSISHTSPLGSRITNVCLFMDEQYRCHVTQKPNVKLQWVQCFLKISFEKQCDLNKVKDLLCSCACLIDHPYIEDTVVC